MGLELKIINFLDNLFQQQLVELGNRVFDM